MATRLIPILYQAIDSNGDPINGAKLYFYATGTTTPKDTYSDEALSVANANPVICNSDGRPANGSGDPIDIFGVSKEDYKVILKDASDNTIETKDPVDSITYNINSFDPRPYQHWGTTTNTADAYRIKPVPSITAYSNGIRFSMVAHVDNNANCTLAVFEEGTTSTYLSALTMKKFNGAGALVNLESSDMEANQTYDIYINATNPILLNPQKPYIDLKNSAKYSNQKITIANGTDTEHDIDFGVGTSVFDDGTGQVITTAMTKQIDAVFSIGTNAGGLDTGSVSADTWYYMYSIYNPTTEVSDYLFSESATSPTLPSGYTKKRRIYSLLTDGSANILNGTWTGNYFEFIEPIVQTFISPSVASNNLSIEVPPIDKINAVVKCYGEVGTGSGEILKVSVGKKTENLLTSTSDIFLIGDANRYHTLYKNIPCVDGEIKYEVFTSTGTRALKIITYGYTDYNL